MNKMNIKELAEKYELGKDDFWEHRKGQWIIKHDACEKIRNIEEIIFEPVEIVNYDPTIITENGEKVQKVNKWGKENWQPAWAGTCQKKAGDVALLLTCYKKDNPDFKVQTTGEANATNCVSQHLFAMAMKRGEDRGILKIINAYEYGIYSDVEADDFEKVEKRATQPQLDKLHNIAAELDIELMGIENMNRDDVSKKIDELQDRLANKQAEEKAREKEQLIKG